MRLAEDQLERIAQLQKNYKTLNEEIDCGLLSINLEDIQLSEQCFVDTFEPLTFQAKPVECSVGRYTRLSTSAAGTTFIAAADNIYKEEASNHGK